LKKKFGTTCHYEMISPDVLHQVISPDRIKHEGPAQIRTFARLTKVVDRWGNELRYSYSSADSLIPSKIEDLKRPGHAVSIQHDGARVQKVRAPNGEITEYVYTDSVALGLTNYSTRGDRITGAPPSSTRLLTQVKKGSSTVSYSYTDAYEQEFLPRKPEDPQLVTNHYYLELASITDERGGTYSFNHDLNTRFYYFDGKVDRRQYGLPMILTGVTSPPIARADTGVFESGTLTITTGRSIPEGQYTTPPFDTAFAWSHGNEARTYKYSFSGPVQLKPIPPTGYSYTGNPNSITVAFAKMVITAPDQIAVKSPAAPLVETYEFNTTTNMALSSVTDRNKGKTTFEYGTDGFDDPIKETNAAGNSKTFTYDPATRILTSTTDARGVQTLFTLDTPDKPGLGRRTNETLNDPTKLIPGGHAKSWTFDNTFPGFITSETVDEGIARTSSNPTTNYPAIKKTISYANSNTGLGWWRKITETIDGTIPPMTTTTITDFSGNKRSVTDGRGLTTAFDYDERGRLVRVTHPDNSFRVLDYDAHGNLVVEVDEEGVYRFHEYDAWNRRIKSTLD
jgi:YD repeat-containing protein